VDLASILSAPAIFFSRRQAMRIGSIPYLVTAVLALTTLTAQVRDSRTTSDGGITRRLVIDERTVQAVRATYGPGVAEPLGPHSFDVVMVPLTQGEMKVTIAGKTVEWTIGEPIFVPRGVAHDVVNLGKMPVEFVSIRIP
jgi:mannose-6-phosphate isomerase-like protein (cupin superfamily)